MREPLREKVEEELERAWGAYSAALEAVTPEGAPDYRVRYQAASALLTEAYGKPVQPMSEQGSIQIVVPDWAVPLHRAPQNGTPPSRAV